MTKPKKQDNNKPRVKIKFLNVLLVLLGADLILLFAPGLGILNSVLNMGEGITWSALIAGIILLVFGFKDLYRKR